ELEQRRPRVPRCADMLRLTMDLLTPLAAQRVISRTSRRPYVMRAAAALDEESACEPRRSVLGDTEAVDAPRVVAHARFDPGPELRRHRCLEVSPQRNGFVRKDVDSQVATERAPGRAGQASGLGRLE